jgi:integrase
MPVSGEQLWLFECGGVDLSALSERSEVLQAFTRAPATVYNYQSDWKQYIHWCNLAGRNPLPAEPQTVQLYVTWMLDTIKRKITTAERHVSAIAHFHRLGGFASPVSPPLRRTIRGVQRARRERPKGKAALNPGELVRIAKKFDAGTALGTRDRALLVLGFATSLRRNELARLQLSDIVFEARGLAVFLRYSKRDQEGKGRVIGVWAGQRATTDPVRVLRAWIRYRGDWPGALFCRVQTGDVVKQRPVSGEALNEAVKRGVASIGLDPDSYGTHSLRAGAITAAARLGRSDQEIMEFSGHKTAKTMRMYVRSARLFEGRNPLAGVL